MDFLETTQREAEWGLGGISSSPTLTSSGLSRGSDLRKRGQSRRTPGPFPGPSRARQGHRGHPFVPRTAWGIVEAWGSLTSPSPQRQERLPGGGHTGCQAEAGTGQCPRASKKPNPRTVPTDTPTSPHGTWAPVGTLNVLGPFHRCPGNVFAQDWVFWWAFRGEMSPGKIYARKDSVWMPSAPCPHVLSPPV